MAYTQSDYERERAICDKAAAYWQANATFARNGASSMSSELASHPDYAACDNAMRGRVEQYELLRDLPERFGAYIGRDDLGLILTTWTGDFLGRVFMGARWRVYSHWGSHMATYYATVGGREYVGRGFGEGMCISLRQTAASKRKAAA